jgi:hypothetical protein
MKEMNNENKYGEKIEGGGDRMEKREEKKVEIFYPLKQQYNSS